MAGYAGYADRLAEALTGREIVAVVEIPPEEMGWWEGDTPPVALYLDDGTVIVPQRDPEGNGPGFLNLIRKGTP